MRQNPAHLFDPPGRRAFTLTELLVVIALIVLMVTLAVPAFRVISGGRSIDVAQNQLAAAVARARTDAVALQEERGLFFYIDPATSRVGAVLVRSRSDLISSAGATVLDTLPDRDGLILPVGVGLQTLIDCTTPAGGGPRTSEGYMGFNTTLKLPPTTGATQVPFGGVILFDGTGRMESKPYAFVLTYVDQKGVKQWTEMGKLLYDVAPGALPGGNPTPDVLLPGVKSQPGFVLFDSEAFAGPATNAGGTSSGGTLVDPLIVTGSASGYSGSPEAAEEWWLDENALPFLVNRYNGTLIRAGQ